MDGTMAVAQRMTVVEYLAREDLPRMTEFRPQLPGFALALDELFKPRDGAG